MPALAAPRNILNAITKLNAITRCQYTPQSCTFKVWTLRGLLHSHSACLVCACMEWHASHEDRAPTEPGCAQGLQSTCVAWGRHRAAGRDGAAAHGLVQRERDGRGAGVAVAGQVADHALRRHAQPLRRAVQDALRARARAVSLGSSCHSCQPTHRASRSRQVLLTSGTT